MSEQQTITASACPHPEAVGRRWGDQISEERQAELRGMLDAWKAEKDHGERKGPFHHEWLTGADVFWLAARAGQEGLGTEDTAEDVLRQVTVGRFRELHISQAIKQSFSIIDMSKLNLAGAVLLDAHLEAASLAQAHLEHASLRHAYLEGAIIDETHFEDADLVEADLRDVFGRAVHLERANLHSALMERADLSAGAHLDGAVLWIAHLEGARLDDAHCEAASFRFANLTDAALRSAYLGHADFSGATLEGTALVGADMEQVNLRGALLDRKTILRGAVFADGDRYGPTVVDVRWGDVNLAALDLAAVSKLGDERIVQIKAAERNQVLLKSLSPRTWG